MIHEIAQGSQEWRELRLGKITASRVADVVAKTKSGWGASRDNYGAELIAERLTGQAQERYTNAAMQHGTDTEPLARAAYEFYRGCEVQQVGFIDHPTVQNSGASPDGLVGTDGLIEIKCPNTATHIETLLGAEIPNKYLLQMQWQMVCSGRVWCDFASFDPRLPEAMKLHVRRVDRDTKIIDMLEKEIAAFDAELCQKLEKLRSRYERKQ